MQPAIDALVKAGADVQRVALDLSGAQPALEVIWGASHAALVRDFDGAQLAALDPGLLRLVDRRPGYFRERIAGGLCRDARAEPDDAVVSSGLRSPADADRSHHRFRRRRRHARRHALPAMVRLDAADMAVQPHPPACGLGALRICRGSADRVADRGADVFRAEHPPGEPLRRAGLRHRCAAGPWPRVGPGLSMADYADANPPYACMAISEASSTADSDGHSPRECQYEQV